MLRLQLLSLSVLAALAYCSLLLKAEVQDIKNEYRILNSKIDTEQEEIHLLKAELVHLKSPERLKKLSTKYLKLKNITTAQLVMDPAGKQALYQNTNIKTRMRMVNWRYKKSPYTTNSEVRQASHRPGN